MTHKILQHLRIEKKDPSLKYLQELITAYCTTVPWESVSKIVKKSSCGKQEDCIGSENEFWTQSFKNGTGGTCYESNWAFYKLLESLGFSGYLTINKIVDKSSVHSSIIVSIDSCKYIADIGYPLYAPIPIVDTATGYAKYQSMEYRSTYIQPKEYLIENFPHPKPYLYHLSDIPVNEGDYRKVCINDYCDTGLFLDRIIIRKIIDNTPTRFDSLDLPYNIHQLQNGTKTKTNLAEENLIADLGTFFKLNSEIIKKAFNILNQTA